MGILLFLAILIGVYFAITVVLKWLLNWIFSVDESTWEFHETSETQKEIEDFIDEKN